jgi:ribonuclease R
VHRLIREFFINHNNTKKSRDYWSRQIAKIAEQSSKREQKATEAEREILEIKKAEYMANFIGDEFEGIVCSLTDFGFFVELENTVQGLVSFEKLVGRWFFDEESYVVRSETGREVFSIGDQVTVKLLSSNKDTQKIDFELKEKTD